MGKLKISPIPKDHKKILFLAVAIMTLIIMAIFGTVFYSTFNDYFLKEDHESYSMRIDHSERNFTATIYLKFETDSTDFWAEEAVHVTVGVESPKELCGGEVYLPKSNIPAKSIEFTRGNIGLKEPEDEELHQNYSFPFTNSEFIGENLVYFPRGGSYDLDLNISTEPNNPEEHHIYEEDIISIVPTFEKRMYQLTKVGTLFSGIAYFTAIYVLSHKLKKLYDWSNKE